MRIKEEISGYIDWIFINYEIYFQMWNESAGVVWFFNSLQISLP